MATTKELLEESLDVMRERYRNPEHMTRDIFQGDELGTKHVKRLVGGGYLRKIIDGWYYVPFDRTEEDETEWYMFYWSFVVAYLDRKYGEDWCLGADDSLVFLRITESSQRAEDFAESEHSSGDSEAVLRREGLQTPAPYPIG